MSIAGAADGDVFLTYLREVLGPQLQAGDVVVMDNLSAHKVAGVREAMTSAQPVVGLRHDVPPPARPGPSICPDC